MCLPLCERLPQHPTPHAARKEGHPQPDQASRMHEASPAADGSSSLFGRRLIFFGAAENKTEPALLQLFSQHGEVADMFIVRSALGISSGCGHVTFSTKEQAKAALQGLKGSSDCAEPGTALGLLIVQEGPTSASPSSTSSAAAAAADHTPSTGGVVSPRAVGASSSSSPPQPEVKLGKSVFFTKVPPTVTQQQLIQLFGACGHVTNLELFIPWPGAKISRGCGLVEFSSSSSAAAAVHSLHQAFTWPHSHSALVVEWADRNRQGSNNKAKQPRTSPGSNSSMLSSPGGMPGSGAGMRADHGGLPAAGAAGYGWRQAPTQQPRPSPPSFGSAASMPQAQLMQLRQQAGLVRSSHSCPLPQLPPGWHVIGTAQPLPPAARMALPQPNMSPQWGSVPSSLSTMAGPLPLPAGKLQAGSGGTATAAYLQAQAPHLAQQGVVSSAAGDALALHQQQQLRNGACGSESGSAGSWLACPVTSTLSNTSMDLSSLTSLGSVYDSALLSSSTFSSAANSAANSGALHSQLTPGWDPKQQQQLAAGKVLDLSSHELAACPAGIATSAGVMGQLQYSEPMLTASAATAAAMSGNSNEAIWQQLLQQNVMLFQTMTPPSEEEPQVLLPSSGAGQGQGLQATGMLASAGSGNGGAGMYHLAASQQMTNAPVLYSNSSLQQQQAQAQAQSQQRRQQLWWLQQGQQAQQQQVQAQQVQVQQQQQAQQQQVQAQQAAAAAAESSAVVALPLSQRQLAAMAGVLPEVPKLTGAQAWISSAAVGGLQLCLSGTYAQLQAGHTAVAMLLGKAGINEPLAPAVVHAAAN